MIETKRLQPQIDANDEEDSPTDTTNPAFPDESPTLPPTPGDTNGLENSDPTPTRPLSPQSQSSQHSTLASLTRPPNRPVLNLHNTASSYATNPPNYFQVTSPKITPPLPQANAFTTGPSSPETLTWTKPQTSGDIPSPRRAHTTAYYNDRISDLNNLVWKRLELKGRPPISRGYHTSNLVGSKLVVYGGSDGHECFSDVHILDLEKNTWTQIDVANSHKRLSHTATQSQWSGKLVEFMVPHHRAEGITPQYCMIHGFSCLVDTMATPSLMTFMS
ncbi:4854_t:CDS:2 [Acaulospora colombiana]|uniref:4854_t:CDS:1 n=1 Tax=Acaulospora colombiana TaxID=27376 RepID=A0ACA9LGW2_9GLOM|nr:4854_t:CDS:2 [Acaulospora colombiana]